MVAAIAMVKDEADVIGQFVRHLAGQVDWMLIADNLSTDGTREILDELADEFPLTIVEDLELAYRQSEKMSNLAERAAELGAEWVIPADADECWYSPFGRLADVVNEHGDAAILTAMLYDHVATAADPAEGTHVERIGWRRTTPLALPKVACRAVLRPTILTGNHGATFPTDTVEGQLVIRHYPYRSPDQFVSKARNGSAALAASGLPEHQGQHWRDYGRLLETFGPESLGDVFREYFWSADPEGDSALIFDPLPTR